MKVAWQTLVAVALLGIALAAGAFLRLDALGAPSYWLDEILHEQLTEEAKYQPLSKWLTGFSAEHGPLYYLTQLVSRLDNPDTTPGVSAVERASKRPYVPKAMPTSAAGRAGRPHSEFVGRLPAALFGIATIALVWLAAIRVKDLGWLAAAAGAAFIALSPLHVYYSREARAYSLLMFLAAALIVALLRARTPLVPSIAIVAILYTTAAAAPLIGAAFVVAALCAFMSKGRDQFRFAVIAVISAMALACMPLLYAARPVEDASWPGFPDIDASFVFGIVRAFTVTALDEQVAGRAAILMLVAAVIGAIAVIVRCRITGVILIGMTVLPLAFALAALRFLDHFYAVRYVTPAVAGFTILAGVGVAALAVWISQRLRSFANQNGVALVLLLVMAGVFATQTWPIARREAFQKLDWRAIAETLRKHVRRGDVILAAEPWSEVSLRHYLGEIAGVKLIHMKGWGIAEIVTQQSPAAWLVTAGASVEPSVREWMCRHPVLLASPLEGFRLHYAPSPRHFLHERSGPAELRAVSAALGDRGFTLRIGSDDAIAIGSGWALPEGSAGETFRWAVGRRATLMFPRREPRNRSIRFLAYPMQAPMLPPQRVHVLLNGNTVGSVTLGPQWSDYSIDIATSFWKEGMNTLTLDFSRANAPDAFDPTSPDHRSLAAAFRRISIDDAGFDSNAMHRDRPLVPSMHLATDALLPDARTVRSKTRFPAAQLRREPVEALLGRLGFDPVSGWTKIARAELRLEDFAETIAAGSDCEDDNAFLQRAFAILLERQPNEIERKDLLRRLREGTKREQVIVRITRADDFLK